jgi:UDP-perosamine 4-acetyltransferase
MATLAEIGGYQVCGFLDDTPGLAGQELAGVPVWSGDEMSGLVAAGIGALATHIASDTFRLELRERAKAAGLTLLNVVHPAAVLAPSVRLGIGNVIKAGAIVDAHVRIGDCCIIDNGAIVPHNNVLGDGCHLAPGVRMGGDCLIGDTTLVGVGAIVTSRVRIGSNAIISPGAVVMGDVGEDMVVAGVPARVIGNRR